MPKPQQPDIQTPHFFSSFQTRHTNMPMVSDHCFAIFTSAGYLSVEIKINAFPPPTFSETNPSLFQSAPE